jgi:hypothetical protein
MKIKALASVAAGMLTLGLAANANATVLSFGITSTGTTTVDTGNITAATATKTLSGSQVVTSGSISDPGGQSGITDGASVIFSTLTLNTTNGAFFFTVSVGDLVFTFTSVSQVAITPTGVSTPGSLSEQFNGTVTTDLSVDQLYIGQTVSLSEACTQVSATAPLSCSESTITPGLPVTTPEPATLGILGLGLAGLGFARRRKH